MAIYRKIDTRVWSDLEFLAMGIKEKLAWLYLLTSEYTNLIGLFKLPIKIMAEVLTLKEDECISIMHKLEDRGMVVYDKKYSLVWIVKWLKYQAPAGPKQAKGYLLAVKELPKHKFTTAFKIALAPFLIGVEKFRFSRKHSIIIRDGCRCSYCGKMFTEWSDVELDHVDPKIKSNTYSDLVASCKDCNQKKGNRTAEDFGFPFVSGYDYHESNALVKLVVDTELRRNFKNLTNGLPPALFAGIEEADIDKLLEKVKYDDDLDTPSIGYSIGYTKSIDTPSIAGTENRNREQEQRTRTENKNREQKDGKASPSVGQQLDLASPSAKDQSPKECAFSLLQKLYPNTKNAEGMIEDLVLAYPSLNIAAEITSAREWELNPNKNKRGPIKNPNSFLRNWVKRAEEFQRERYGVLRLKGTASPDSDTEPKDAGKHLRDLEARALNDRRD